jgi:hypothetical protein
VPRWNSTSACTLAYGHVPQGKPDSPQHIARHCTDRSSLRGQGPAAFNIWRIACVHRQSGDSGFVLMIDHAQKTTERLRQSRSSNLPVQVRPSRSKKHSRDLRLGLVGPRSPQPVRANLARFCERFHDLRRFDGRPPQPTQCRRFVRRVRLRGQRRRPSRTGGARSTAFTHLSGFWAIRHAGKSSRTKSPGRASPEHRLWGPSGSSRGSDVGAPRRSPCSGAHSRESKSRSNSHPCIGTRSSARSPENDTNGYSYQHMATRSGSALVHVPSVPAEEEP